MKNTTLIIITAVAAAAVIGVTYSRKMIAKYKAAADQIQYKLSSIKNLNIKRIDGILTLTANVEIMLTNPTNVNFDIETKGGLVLKKITLKTDKGQDIGEAFTTISKIKIPAKGTYITPSINIKSPINGNAFNIVRDILFKTAKVEAIPHFDLFGNPITINPNS